MSWFEKLKPGMEARGFLQYQVYPCMWYREDMALLLYVDDCLIFSPSNNKINYVYASLQADFKIKDDGYITKYLGIYLYHHPNGSIHIR